MNERNEHWGKTPEWYPEKSPKDEPVEVKGPSVFSKLKQELKSVFNLKGLIE